MDVLINAIMWMAVSVVVGSTPPTVLPDDGATSEDTVSADDPSNEIAVKPTPLAAAKGNESVLDFVSAGKRRVPRAAGARKEKPATGQRGAGFEVAAMVTNDSDLLEPMRIVRTELNLPVGLVNLQTPPSFHLRAQATFMKTLRPGVLRASQFPSSPADAHGTFHKPEGW